MTAAGEAQPGSLGGLTPAPGVPVVRPSRQRTSSWPLVDRIGYWLCWGTGIALCAIALAIVLFMLVKGISYLRPSLFVQSPAPAVHQSEAGGFFDPIVGTFILTAIGIADRGADRHRDRGVAVGVRAPGGRSRGRSSRRSR